MKNTDYSASAVNLKNDINLAIDLQAYHGLSDQIKELQIKIDAAIPQEMKDQLSSWQTQLNACGEAVRTDIEQYGSYQDLDKGWYAVKQRKISKSYNAGLFRTYFPEFAPAVIIEAIDTTKLNGLIKGGLLNEEGLKRVSILEEKESFSIIIK